MNLSIIFQQLDTEMNIIYNNPYRILGVYANSRRQEFLANKGKATAFLKVGKVVEYPLDLKGILPPIARSVEILSEAESHLSLAKEQLKYVQFWFLKMTPLDDVAFNHLIAGNITGAEEIWSKQDSLSSLQNKIVCYLIENKLQAAVIAAEMLYEKYGDTYINKVDVNCTLQMSGSELLHLFLDSLGEEIGFTKLIGLVSGEEAKVYIRSNTIVPLISKISSEVERTKKVDHKDPKARIEAARSLVKNTRESFTQLKNILLSTDSQYQMIADKLGLEILQCGIDYFNNSEDEDAPHTAMKMQKYAQSIVVGTLAKQRCEENVKILQKIIDELPPKEVITEDRAIKAELSRFVRLPDKISYAVTLLNNTKPHLQSIKNKLGATNSYYLKLSTQIVSNALHNVVEEVNAVQSDPQISVRLQLGLGLDSTSLSRLKDAFREAWKATTIMDGFDLEPNFKSHYNDNRNTLKSMCNQMGISTYAGRPTFSSQPVSRPTTQTRPSTAYEREYGNASAGEALWEHIKSPESSRWEAATILTVLGGLIGFLIYYNNPDTIGVDEKWSYILWGAGIGAISWFCILVDNDDKDFDASSFGNGGCVGALLLIGLFIFYWIYKIIRLTIDGIKGA